MTYRITILQIKPGFTVKSIRDIYETSNLFRKDGAMRQPLRDFVKSELEAGFFVTIEKL